MTRFFCTNALRKGLGPAKRRLRSPVSPVLVLLALIATLVAISLAQPRVGGSRPLIHPPLNEKPLSFDWEGS